LRGIGQEARHEDLPERRRAIAPPEFGEFEHQIALAAHRRVGMARAVVRGGESAEENELAHALRMARGVLDGDAGRAGESQQDERLGAVRIGHRFEVADPRVERDVVDASLRQSAAAGVVLHVGVPRREFVDQRGMHRSGQHAIDVREPGGGLDQRRAGAIAGCSELHTVA